MGSGHFLVEACRFLGDALYEAVRLCDEKASELERQAEKREGRREKGGNAASQIPNPQSPIPSLLADAQKYRQRVMDLPDPDNQIVRYLPSRSPEGEESGISQRKAEALCRRMVAVHCLYGVDKNPLAVELAKLALWLESHAEGMPLTFLDHRLVVGDSLTGPFWDKLIMRPSDPEEPVEGVFHQGLTLALQKRLAEALSCVRHLEATVGISMAEVQEKEHMKAELDRALRPFRIIAAAWSGGVMLGPEKCDDLAYADLLKSVAETGEIPERIESDRLRAMVAHGLSLKRIPDSPERLYELLTSPHCIPALPYDLTFPEVFYPTGVPHGRRGFNAAVGNPPWEELIFDPKEYLISYDLTLWEKKGGAIDAAISRLRRIPRVAESLCHHESEINKAKNVFSNSYSYQGKEKGRGGLGHCDLYRLFFERCLSLVVPSTGRLGLVLPSSFHANLGARAVRQLALYENTLREFFCFENTGNRFFDIHAQMKFSLIDLVRHAPRTDHTIECAFDQHDDAFLFDSRERQRVCLRISAGVIEGLDPRSLTFPEVASQEELDILTQFWGHGEHFQRYCLHRNIAFGLFLQEDKSLDVLVDAIESDDPRTPGTASRLLESAGCVILHEGETFHQYNDRWHNRPSWLVDLRRIPLQLRNLSPYYKLVYRRITNSKNERTSIFCVLPPPCLCGHSVPVEKAPASRPNGEALYLAAICNTYSFDFLLRQKVTRNINFFHIEPLPIPVAEDAIRVFTCRGALRLSCNHSGYEPLWREQVGDAWREEGKEPFTWPVLAGDDQRWEVRAAIDAVVADAYGLSRDQYEHVLSTFSHASYPKAPQLCLAKFDELKRIGLDAFTRKYDPYHDIPLNENLPQPVIDLPLPGDAKKGEQGKLF